MSRLKLEEIESNAESRVSQLKIQHGDLTQRLEDLRTHFSAEIERIRSDHDAELDSLDAEVKHNIGVKEEELGILRDAVETEKIKMSKLEKMVKRYTSTAS